MKDVIGPRQNRMQKGNTSNRSYFEEPPIDIISLSLGVMAFLVVTYLIRYVFDPDWFSRVVGFYSVIFSALCLIGILGSVAILNWKANLGLKDIIDLRKKKWGNMFLRMGLVFGVIVIIEALLVVSGNLTIGDGELALYYVFGAVIEEFFFRAFLINLIHVMLGTDFKEILAVNKDSPFYPLFKYKINAKSILAAIISGVAFWAVHIPIYINNPIMLFSILFQGLFLGIIYVLTFDLTAIIGAHFFKNFAATINILVLL